jgi:hypothetical protein
MANMLRLAQAPNLQIATLWADVLKSEGIQATVERQFLASAAGELPPDQCLPEVWIENHQQETMARQVLYDMRHIPQQRWFCICGELVEGGFQQCWNCSALMLTR